MNKIDCKEIAEAISKEVKEEVAKIEGRKPCLATIIVGNDYGSSIYVRNKHNKAEELGILNPQFNCDEDISEDDLIHLIESLNKDCGIDGILVQLPLPKHINTDRVINAISAEKDVDGFSPINVGKMMLGQDCFLPCTPQGILEVLKYANIDTEGKEVIVIGRSNIVGRPIANILSQKPWNANVTLLHSHTSTTELKSKIQNAEIVILAVGQANFINTKFMFDTMIDADFTNRNITFIDVGINRIEDSTKKSGFRTCGDFDTQGFEGYFDKLKNDEETSKSWKDLAFPNDEFDWRYTPVPGGIGVLTVCCLMKNVLKAYKVRNKENNK